MRKVAFNSTRYFGPEVWYDKDGGEVRLSQSLAALGHVDVLRVPAHVLEKHVFPALREAPAARMSSRFSSVMPPIANHGIVTCCAAQRTVSG